MKKTFIFILIMLASWLTWTAWNPPTPHTLASSVHLPLPNIQPLNSGPWRVLTRRLVWKKAVDDMQERLRNAGLSPQLLHKKEDVGLHVFDDAQTFDSRKQAKVAEQAWQKLKFDTSIFQLKGSEPPQFKIGLGRFYLTEYAERIQENLRKSKRPYQYERRTVTIPSFHFVFPSMSKDNAKIMWNRLQNLGIADPVIMQESEFKRLYPKK
ncbi:MAG: hypothetical protein R8K49_00535 [Mariprofundaceae bacterium]